uniref:Secreted protein n=1 Tax=Bionectria ochroleuca TaxID=29856 RepID=A0A8H7TP62_BIOOC
MRGMILVVMASIAWSHTMIRIRACDDQGGSLTVVWVPSTKSKPTYQPAASSHSPAIRNGAQSELVTGNTPAMVDCITDIQITSITASLASRSFFKHPSLGHLGSVYPISYLLAHTLSLTLVGTA